MRARRDWWRAAKDGNTLQMVGAMLTVVVVIRLLLPDGNGPAGRGSMRGGGPIDPLWLPLLRGAIPVGVLVWFAGTWVAWRAWRR